MQDLGNQASVPLQTASLSAIRELSYGIHSSDSITVCAEARIGKNLSSKLGGISRHFAASRPMEGAHVCFLILCD